MRESFRSPNDALAVLVLVEPLKCNVVANAKCRVSYRGMHVSLLGALNQEISSLRAFLVGGCGGGELHVAGALRLSPGSRGQMTR